MSRDLSRLLRPRSVAVVGGGAWGEAVVGQLAKAGFAGPVWPVHPTRTVVAGLPAVAAPALLPSPPDAVFVGINREATVSVVSALSGMGAGGAVCFAAGFAEVADGGTLTADLVAAAGDMPILGPNCYGMINALDGALLWPDQHGCVPVDRGVAILTQSSNIAINLTMNARSVPLAYVVTCGNQAQTTQAQIALGLLDDPRVTAIGLHVEGFGELDDWQTLARAASLRNVPLVALKVGRSAQAQAATVSHTASLAGGDAGAQALLDRLGIARVDDLGTFLETLKLWHVAGHLPSRAIASISCSGGEASLVADLGTRAGLAFPTLTTRQTTVLSAALGPRVALANPLDYNTYIWRDTAAMTAAFSGMADPGIALTALIVDFPRPDRCDPADWDCVIDASLATRAATGRPVAMIATLPELLPEAVAAHLLAGGVIPMNGLPEALSAIAAAIRPDTPDLGLDLCRPGPAATARLITEAEAKLALSAHGLPIPGQVRAARDGVAHAARSLAMPVVVKGEGLAHKSEAGAVALNLATPDAAQAAADAMPATSFLIEEMVTGTVAELLVGVVRDPAHGFVLTLGAGGVLTELMRDTVSLLIPASPASVDAALESLRIAPLLRGYRGRPAADRAAILGAIAAVQRYVAANADRVAEVEVNPLLCTPVRAVAADALIRIAPEVP